MKHVNFQTIFSEGHMVQQTSSETQRQYFYMNINSISATEMVTDRKDSANSEMPFSSFTNFNLSVC